MYSSSCHLWILSRHNKVWFFYNYFTLFWRNADNDFADVIRVPETGLISGVSWDFFDFTV